MVYPAANTTRINDRTANKGEYCELLKFKTNPFKIYQGEGVVSTLNALRMTSSIMLEAILEAFADYGRIEKLVISNSGLLTINDIEFKPTVHAHILESFPIDLKDQVQKGYVGDLLNFKDIRKFKNLQLLVIETYA